VHRNTEFYFDGSAAIAKSHHFWGNQEMQLGKISTFARFLLSRDVAVWPNSTNFSLIPNITGGH